MAKTKYWSPVGRCIYCGVSGVPLSDEHAVPEGLGGEHVLPQASCATCARITSEFERACLRDMWPEARAYFKIRSKRSHTARAKRPSKFPVTFTGDSEPEPQDVAIADYPFHMFMPVLPRARCISPGGQPNDPYPDPREPGGIWVGQAQDAVERSQRLFRARNMRHKKNVAITLTLPLAEFCRLLAKIAHVMAVANAQSPFRTVLSDFILGRPNAPIGTFFVGGAFWPDGSRIESIANGEGLHSTISLSHPFEGWRLNYARIQLFALAGAPVYEVVTGFGELPNR